MQTCKLQPEDFAIMIRHEPVAYAPADGALVSGVDKKRIVRVKFSGPPRRVTAPQEEREP